MRVHQSLQRIFETTLILGVLSFGAASLGSLSSCATPGSACLAGNALFGLGDTSVVAISVPAETGWSGSTPNETTGGDVTDVFAFVVQSMGLYLILLSLLSLLVLQLIELRFLRAVFAQNRSANA